MDSIISYLSTVYYCAIGASIFSGICLTPLIVQYYIYRKRFNRLENTMLNLRNELRQQMQSAPQTPSMPLPPTNQRPIQQFQVW